MRAKSLEIVGSTTISTFGSNAITSAANRRSFENDPTVI